MPTMRESMKDFINSILPPATKPIPPADPIDKLAYPFGKLAGDNKYSLTICPTCHKPPTPYHGKSFFLFHDSLSAHEYAISGMCQACQDNVFNTEQPE